MRADEGGGTRPPAPGAGGADAPGGGHGSVGPGLEATARASGVEDVGHFLDEDFRDWTDRGVDAGTIPYLYDVIRLAHSHRWPLRVLEVGGWNCVVLPCYADLAGALEQVLDAAVAPTSPESDHPFPRGEPSGAAGGPVQPTPEEETAGLDLEDADGVTWLTPAARRDEQ